MNLLPQVKEKNNGDGFFYFEEYVPIVISTDSYIDFSTIELLSKRLEISTTRKFPVTTSLKNEEYKSIVICCSNKNFDNEKYTLSIKDNKITIIGDSNKGIFYGTQTLAQIVSLNPVKIPCMEINDSPDFAHRGYYHDITRGKVPTLETLKMLVEKLAFYKINELQLYIEHSYAFREIPELWIDKDPITSEEILELDSYCKKYYIDLIPSLATFGHLYELLRIKRFEHLNELDIKASELPHDLWDRMAHYTIDPLNKESLDLISSMLEEYLPLFSSKYFNICCDETFDLGKGKNAKVAQEKGDGRLYVDFLKKIIGIVIKHGKIPMFWGDIVLRHPELIKEIPSNTIFLNWAYGADVTEDATATFCKAGVQQYVCPGVTGWSRFANDINFASKNIKKMIQYGKKYSADGVLNTDWGDCGHVNFISSSYHGMIFGASLSWNSDSYLTDQDFDCAVSQIEWKNQTGTIASKLRELGSLCFYHFGNLYAWVKNKDGLWNKEQAVKDLSIEVLSENYDKASRILEEISEIRAVSGYNKDINFREIMWSAKAIRWTIALLVFKKVNEYHQAGTIIVSKQKLIDQTTYLCDEFKILWRSRNKESELYNVVKIFKVVIEKLNDINE